MRPLDRLNSIKLKLGVLVAASVLVASVLAVASAASEVPAALTVPIVVLLALGVTQLLARGMTSPLREMTAAARAMATGDYERRVTATSHDEVGELARAFNTMAGDLAAVDRQRRELVANVSHELRTPVSALRAVLENLADGVAPADPATLRTALVQAERLGLLVDELLDLARVDAGMTPLDVETLPVAPLLEAAVTEARLAPRDVEYDVQVSPAELTVQGDRARLRQLLANLLDNASRHTPSGSRVQVRGRSVGAQTVLEVADEGPGIAPAERAAVFERFHTGRSDQDGGTGLGLAIARWVIQLHGGTIEVVDGETPGCTIRATLPCDTESGPDGSLPERVL
jgi:signal transduction histidine kinase